MEVIKGYLTRTYEGGMRGQVEIITGEIIDNVLLMYPYGFASNMETETNAGSMVLLFKPMGSSTNIFGVPYNPLLQPKLAPTEAAHGNFKKGNKVTWKANGDVVIDCESTVTINGGTINLADANALVLNENANMQVTIPGGSSAGTYTVTINNPGQSKVSA